MTKTDFRCVLCDREVTIAEAIAHFREYHPEVEAATGEFMTWPDGGLVIDDHTLTPDDFTTE